MCEWERLIETDDATKMAALYDKFVQNCLDKHAPVRRIKIRSSYSFGLSDETKAKMKQRDNVRLQASHEKGSHKQILIAKYKSLRNECNRLVW